VNICLDFDGVLHDHSATVFPKMGVPVDGALEAVHELLRQGHELTISTCRLGKRERVALDLNHDAWTHVHDWLRYFDFPVDQLTVTYIKPVAHLYIDDRGWRFTSWSDALFGVRAAEELERLAGREDPTEEAKRR
jgi:hypothetical protein